MRGWINKVFHTDGLNVNTTTYTSDGTLSIGEAFILADTTGSLTTLTLPALSDVPNSGYTVFISDQKSNFDTSNLEISPSGSDSIENRLGSLGLNHKDESIMFVADKDNSNWVVLRGLVPLQGVRTSEVEVVNTTTETNVFSETLVADSLRVGDVYELVLLGSYSTANATDTFDIDLSIGGTTLSTTTSIAANATDAPVKIRFTFTVRSIGATGSVITYSDVELDNTGDSSGDTAETTIDTTANNNVECSIQWSAADAGNSVKIEQGFLTKLTR